MSERWSSALCVQVAHPQLPASLGPPGCLCHLLERAMTQMWALPLLVVSVSGTVPDQVGIDNRDVTFMGMQGTGTRQVCVCAMLLNKSGEVERYAEISGCLETQKSLGNCLASWFD